MIYDPRSTIYDLRSRGFTVIEILMVTVIIGMIALFASGTIDKLFPIYRLNYTERRINSAIKLARTKARATNQFAFVVFDLDREQQRYWIFAPKAKLNKEEEGEEEVESKPPEYMVFLEDELPKDVEISGIIKGPDKTLTSGKVFIPIDPFGYTSSLLINIGLQNNKSVSHSIKFSGSTSRVEYLNKEGAYEDLVE